MAKSQTEGLQHGLEIVADNGWFVVLKGRKMGFFSGEFYLKSDQNGSHQFRFFNKINTGGRDLFVLVELKILGFVVAAVVFFTVLVFAAMPAFRTSFVAGFVATRFHEDGRICQFVLAKMVAQREAGGAEKYSGGKDDMEEFSCQRF